MTPNIDFLYEQCSTNACNALTFEKGTLKVLGEVLNVIDVSFRILPTLR